MSDVAPSIGTLREKPLHASLKEWYALPGDRVECPVDGFVIDLVRGDLLIEIQTSGFSSMKQKVLSLLDAGHRVRLVHPVPADRWIVKVDDDGTILNRRRSPRHGDPTDVPSPGSASVLAPVYAHGMVFDPPRRRRRAWRWMVPILLVAVALIALSASGAGGDARAEIEYLNEMSAQIEAIALGGESLQSVATRLSTIDRPELEVVISDLRADLAEAMEFGDLDPPSNELFAIRSLYRLAVRSWDSGAGNFGEGVLAAADTPGDPAAVDTIANSIVSMRSGDRLFADLLVEIDRADVPDPVTPFRAVALAPGEGQAVTLAVSYSLAAGSPDNGLALRPGLGVSQLIASPEWQINPDDLVIMPATEEATFSAVVSNTGNLVSVEEQIVLTFTGAAEPVEFTALVPPLEPGAQTTVAFEPITVVAGETYGIVVEINVSDIDASFEDNLIEVTFRVNTE